MSVPEFDCAIFFDNEAKNINGPGGVCNVCKNIECVEVDESIDIKDFYDKPWNAEPLASYVKQIGPDNTYLNLLKVLFKFDSYDEVSGIQDYEFDLLNEWIKKTESLPNRVAIFDWDRTITMFEGLAIPNNSLSRFTSQTKTTNLPPIITEHILEYLLGGNMRLRQIRTEVFEKCRDNNISIYILTNNGSANPASVKYAPFVELLNALFLGIPYTLVWSGDTRKKGEKLKSLPEFRKLCIDSTIPGGGGKKRKRTIKGTIKRNTIKKGIRTSKLNKKKKKRRTRRN